MVDHVVLFGPPAAGKGTQAKLISEAQRLAPTSTGDMLRAAVSERTPLGLQAAEVMKAGNLVDDAIIIGIISDYLAQGGAPKGALFDGFPRTVAQAEALDDLMIARAENVRAVVNIIVPDEILLSRVLSRIEQTPIDQRRADDTPQALETRLIAYHQQTVPVLDYYRQHDKIFDIDGTMAIDEVTKSILAEVFSS